MAPCWSIVGIVVFWGALAGAAEQPTLNPGPHRISLGVALEAIVPDISRDANWAEFAISPGIAAGYAYNVLPSLEIGAHAAYWRSTTVSAPDVFIPSLSLRVFVPLTRAHRTELGFAGRAGLLSMRLTEFDRGWHGSAFTFAPDIRSYLAPNWAIQVSFEITRGSATTAREEYTSKQNPDYTSLGLWFRVLAIP